MNIRFQHFLFGLLCCLSLNACSNRAALRIPGASTSFPPTSTGFVAEHPRPFALEVALPVDVRSAHYGERVADTKRVGCETDALAPGSLPAMLQERLRSEFASSKMFNPSDDAASTGHLVLKSEIHAFCSQVRGFMFMRVAGITAINFTLEKDGKVVWSSQIEHVVTDADAEYSGSRVTFIEQAMRTTMADSLRLVMADALKAIDGSQW